MAERQYRRHREFWEIMLSYAWIEPVAFVVYLYTVVLLWPFNDIEGA